jgi:hypothetical protein
MMTRPSEAAFPSQVTVVLPSWTVILYTLPPSRQSASKPFQLEGRAGRTVRRPFSRAQTQQVF